MSGNATSDDRGGEKGTLWRCTACGSTFDEDDLEQSQPDGHYSCPLCQPPADPPMERVQRPANKTTALVRALREAQWTAPEWREETMRLRRVVRILVNNDGLYGGAPGWQEGSPCEQAFSRAMEVE